MARYIGPVCKLCRREGTKLYLKGERCFTDKCAVDRRPYPPGQHGQGRIKLTEYGVRLREKQKVRRIYGVLERQFRGYFYEATAARAARAKRCSASSSAASTTSCYRLGFAATRAEARQLVRHEHMLVNGKRVDIPCYRVKPGDKVEVREKSRKIELHRRRARRRSRRRGIPSGSRSTRRTSPAPSRRCRSARSSTSRRSASSYVVEYLLALS